MIQQELKLAVEVILETMIQSISDTFSCEKGAILELFLNQVSVFHGNRV